MGLVVSLIVGFLEVVKRSFFSRKPQLLVAIRNNDIQEIRKWKTFQLRIPTNPEFDEHGRDPAQLAIHLGNPKVMRELWQAGILLPINGPNRKTPLVSYLVRKRTNHKFLSGFVIPGQVVMSETKKSLVELILNEYAGTAGAYRVKLIQLLKALVASGLNVCATWTDHNWNSSSLFLEAFKRKDQEILKLVMTQKFNSDVIPTSEGIFYVLSQNSWSVKEFAPYYNRFSDSQKRYFLMGSTENRLSSLQLLLIKKRPELDAWWKLCIRNDLLNDRALICDQLIGVMKHNAFVPNGRLLAFIEPRQNVCSICDNQTELIALFNCGHEFCLDCIQNWLSVHAKDNRPSVRCLCRDCDKLIEHSQVVNLAPKDYQAFFDSKILEQHLQSFQYFSWCPKCPNGMIFAPSCSISLCCANCSAQFCAECSHGPHKFYCPNGKSKFEEHRMRVPTKKCPHCKVWIYKDGGCPNMHCTQCNRHFNWSQIALEKEQYVYATHQRVNVK